MLSQEFHVYVDVLPSYVAIQLQKSNLNYSGFYYRKNINASGNQALKMRNALYSLLYPHCIMMYYMV